MLLLLPLLPKQALIYKCLYFSKLRNQPNYDHLDKMLARHTRNCCGVLTRLVKLLLLTNTEFINRNPKSHVLSRTFHQISVSECREVSKVHIPSPSPECHVVSLCHALFTCELCIYLKTLASGPCCHATPCVIIQLVMYDV